MPSRRRRQKQRRIIPDDELAPRIREGLTQDASAAEALQEHPVSTNPSGVEIARNFAAAERAANESPRDKTIHFIARLDPETEIEEPNTGRLMIDATRVIPTEHRHQIQSGYRCIECLEPFDVPWPDHCDVCGFEVRKRQMLRAVHEFEGNTHVGPGKPIREYLADMDARREKREFDQKIAAGKSPMKGLSHRAT